jgi:hypothetical protein
MAILATIFGLLGRFAGKLLTAALGWASTLLFGQVPRSKQILLALITFGSLIWVALVVGVVLPDVGTMLLAFVPVPDFIREEWVRLAMLAGAIVTPLLIGGAGLVLMDERPGGIEAVKQVLRGYPLAAVIAITIAFLAVIALVRKARSLAKRWTDAHVPLIVKPGAYERVVTELEDVLDRAGLAVDRKPASRAVALPGKLLAAVAGPGVDALVPDQLLTLVAPKLEVGLYPSDISISGPESEVARARAAIATRLTAAPAYLTTSLETQKIEDRLGRIAREGAVLGTDGSVALTPAARADLGRIDEELAALVIPYDEWEVLYRMRLQVERDLLVGHRVGDDFPGAEAPPAGAPVKAPEPAWAPVFGLGALVLVLIDVIVAILDRVRPPRRR